MPKSVAKQVVLLTQLIPESPAAVTGAKALHVAPPSLVVAVAPLRKATTHRVEVGQLTSMGLLYVLANWLIFHVAPPSAVRTMNGNAQQSSPTATHVEVDGQLRRPKATPQSMGGAQLGQFANSPSSPSVSFQTVPPLVLT
jgi:hypothetical protein